jgi:Ca-activated chloride channel family protein
MSKVLKRVSWRHYVLLLGLGAVAAILTLGSRNEPATASEAPPTVSNHGHMQTTLPGGKVAVLPLRHTDVDAEVVGVMSAVKVTQQFRNPYRKPIEAVYVFPLPHRAAIHAMTMHVGDRVIRARIKRRKTARAIYKRAKNKGKTAALLEQERPNIFTQSVANIMPGDAIRVELRYVEELSPRDGRYSFVFPMVVGPRYMGEARGLDRRQGGSGWARDNRRVGDASRISPPLLRRGTRPGHDISVTLRINAGVAISDLKSKSHRTTLQQPNPDTATIQLDRGDRIPNKDFVVSYRLAGNAPRVTALAGASRALGGHFLLMVQPKARPAQTDLAPREYVFVVDTSGSMSGTPIQRVKDVMRRCLAGMQPQDRFQVIQFAGGASALSRAPLPLTQSSLSRALAFVSGFSGGGGTEFIPALELALKYPRDPQRARIVLFMSDGYIGYEAEVLRFMRQNLNGANVFVLGVGSSVNRYLIDGMARIGHGEPFVLLDGESDARLVRRFFDTVSRPALTNVTVDWGGLPVERVTPARVPDLFADRPIVVSGRYGPAGGSGTVTVRGLLAGAPYEQKLQVSLPAHGAASSSGAALAYLWARRRIGELMDRFSTETEETPAIKKRVTRLALRYSLMSRWTAFVAVDRKVRNRGGKCSPAGRAGGADKCNTVPVPVPLPDGVTEKAAPPAAFLNVQGALSQDQFVPGDPEVQIRAPESAVKVTLLFPTGEVKACERDPGTGKWRASFLIPEETPDGVYTIRVLITLADGDQLMRTLRYQVDGTEPKARLRLSPSPAAPGETVTVTAEPLSLTPSTLAAPASDIGDPTFDGRVLQEIRSARALLPGDPLGVDLQRSPAGRSWQLSFQAPSRPGRYPVVVVVRDPARNKLRRTLWLEVRP